MVNRYVYGLFLWSLGVYGSMVMVIRCFFMVYMVVRCVWFFMVLGLLHFYGQYECMVIWLYGSMIMVLRYVWLHACLISMVMLHACLISMVIRCVWLQGIGERNERRGVMVIVIGGGGRESNVWVYGLNEERDQCMV